MDGWIAWLIGHSVDLSVTGILLGVRYLATAGYDQHALAKPRRLLVLCGLLSPGGSRKLKPFRQELSGRFVCLRVAGS